MRPRKTPFSTNPQQAASDAAALDEALAALQAAPDNALPIERFADLSRASAARLAERWTALPPALRGAFVRAMVAATEAGVERNYERALLVAFEDADPTVRLAALDGLWEHESDAFLTRLLDAIGAEEHAPLRAAEADALASYVDLVELEELSPALAERLVRTLKDLTASDPDELVRQRALEAVAVVSDDAEISAAVADMYAAGDSDSRASALRAMGRQATERWLTTVGAELSSPEPELRFEAARAAGGLADQRLAPALVDLVEDPDLEVQLAAVGALGAVGGQLAVNTLRRLTRSERPAIAEAATDALDEAELFSGRLTPSLDLLPEPE